ncbi:NUDIX domain-containing protein [Phytomonospora endophytica]|uniref:ADP-ribose pyrophosphatase YjhB (NUDIX family) n=1 Tax=Phytomonospora endophytica TaxID=714109 RepID=A0A841FM76_9ACTN|nr:NUDIX domain-containing protein [Phytomonospora endophytica]MBB6034642.1 ADP-ribose pyrophosphatase YjhB (NUDIX family) [Phytomonospora endophytica]GIG69157.1 hypothetical protein Pen01_54520 [Phytomonospora endophytica]
MPETTVHLVPTGDGYLVPDGLTEAVGVPLTEALHAAIRPLGAAERLLREAVGGPAVDGIPDDPEPMPPTRVRAGAVVVRDGRMLLVALPTEQGLVYEIPGGGVEDGETLEETVRRELAEETGLVAVPGRRIARVWRTSARLPGLFLDHYFLAEVSGEFGDPADLDLDGGEPVWVPVGEIARLPVWPRRLRWRIAHWWEHGWPETVVDLADRNEDLSGECRW